MSLTAFFGASRIECPTSNQIRNWTGVHARDHTQCFLKSKDTRLTMRTMAAPNLFIQASYAASGDYVQVSNDIQTDLHTPRESKLLFDAIQVSEEQDIMEDIIFEPRLDDPETPLEDDVLNFREDEPIKPKENTDDLSTCFQNLKLVTPQFFDDERSVISTNQESRQSNHKKSLADMVHPIDPSLFKNDKDYKYTRKETVVVTPDSLDGRRAQDPDISQAYYSCASSIGGSDDDDSSVCSYKSTRSSASAISNRLRQVQNYLKRQQQQQGNHARTEATSSSFNDLKSRTSDLLSSTPASQRSKLASSFQSTKNRDRVAFLLSSGSAGWSQQEQELAKQLLPRGQLIQSTVTTTTSETTKKKRRTYPETIYILLLEPSRKVFEVVPIDFVYDLTVGDVLAKARSKATDPGLANKYISICNNEQELAAPMLPIRHLLQKQSRRHAVLTAVPEGSNATQCRRISTILLQNPRIKNWLRKADPFAVSPSLSSSCSVTSVECKQPVQA